MPPEENDFQEEDVILLNGEEITKEEVQTKLKALIKTEKMTISVGEKRQIRQYEGNDYHESTTIEISGLSPFLDSLAVGPETRKKLSAMALGMLTTRVNQMYNFMKTSIHCQQGIDGIPNVDYRQGEKEERDA
jgi:hypothetical protein